MLVVLGGKNSNVMLLRATCGCAVQLSNSSKIFFPDSTSSLSHVRSHSSKIVEVIQALALFLYVTGRLSMFVCLKHLGCLLLPMIHNFFLSVPLMLAHTNTVILSKDFFDPANSSFLKHRDPSLVAL